MCRGRDTETLHMKTLKFALLAAGLLAAAPAFAQTAGGTANTGPQGSGNFVAGKPEGSGNFVAGKPKDPAKSAQAGRPARLLGDLGDPPHRHVANQGSPAAGREPP